MKHCLAISISVAVLSGCGGSSDTMMGGGNAPTIAQNTTVVATFPGSVLSKVTNFAGSNGDFDAVILAADQEGADKAFDVLQSMNNREGRYTATVLSAANVDYAGEATGSNILGENVVSIITGLRLSGGGFVSDNAINVGDRVSYATDGTSPSGTTPATATYQGVARFGGHNASGQFLSEDGTFTMTTDFGTDSSDLFASAANSSFSATNISTVDILDSISGPAQISVHGQPSVAAEVLGYFSGVNGEGVHGIVNANNSNVNQDAFATFIGKQ